MSRLSENRPLLISSIFFLIILHALSSGVYAIDVGRYNVSRPSDVDVNPIVSCTQGTAQGAKCHLKTEDKGSKTVPSNLTIGNVEHPGANRAPASLYPEWVHWMHGGSNWPQWLWVLESVGGGWGYGGLSNITAPIRGVLQAGKADVNIGQSGTAGPLAMLRNRDGQEYSETWWTLGDNYEGEFKQSDETNDNAWGNPNVDQGLDQAPPGCGYGTTADVSGCHRLNIDDVDTGQTLYDRSDNIACKYCHNGTGSGINIDSTNSKHNVISGALCSDCHYYLATPSSTPSLGGNDTIIPTTKNCWECHEATSGWNDSGGKFGNTNFSNFLNTTFTHAGRDCRDCHGHAHNISRGDYWNGSNTSGQAASTCGNNDLYCHGDSSTTRYVPPLTHGSENYNVTCNDCHVNPGEPAHNITIPSCDKCHNSTGWSGNADDNSSTNASVPSWDRSNAIYHGNTSRTYSPNPGKKCAECHVPNDITNLSKGFNTEGTPHNINTSQNSGKNYVPSCQEIVCHGNSTDAPIDPDGPEVNGTWIRESHASGLATSKPLECTDCHNNRTVTYWTTSYEINTTLHASYPSNIVPFDIQRDSADGAVDKTVCLNCHEFGALDCASCHSTGGVLIIHDADMDKPDAVIDGAHGAGGPNCVDSSCHDVGNTPSVNVSSMNNTNAMHYYLNNRSGDPGSEIGDGYTLCMDNSAGCINWNSQRCWACHGNGSQPANGTMSSSNATAEGRGNYTNPYYCWDCHVINYTSSGVLDWNGSQNAYNKYPYIKNITEHIMEQYAPDIDTNTSYPLKNGTCQRCHANDIGVTSGSIPKSGGLPASLLANVSHYGQNDSLMTSNVNSTRCLYCHNDSANGSSWGGAPQIFDDTNGMYQANESEDCWYCHTDNNQQPENFHKPILNVITSKCELCHFKYKYFNSTRKSKFINETKFNESVHWNSSVIYCTDCHTNMSFGSARNETHPYQLEGAAFLPPESGWKWCEDCHVYQAPYPNETQQRHNITSEPQNYQVYNKTGDLQGVLDITDCTTCHDSTYYNNATATFNRTSGKDCRWCHTFPELTPASPY